MTAQTTAAIILARGGSKGIPGKNLRPVGGVSLVGRSVRAARAAAGVDAGVWVSTDDAEIAAEARRHGAHVIDRPAEISGDGASSESGWLHALGVIRRTHPGLDRLVFLQCTSPFTTGADIDACLAAQTAQGADCALSAIPDHGFLWHRDADGFGRGANHDETAPRKRRQDLEPAYLESGAIYTVDAAAFERTGQRFCGRVALSEVDHPKIEIDSPDDLAVIAAIAAHRDRAPVDPARLAGLRALVMDFDGVHTDDLVDTAQDGTETVRTSRRDGLGLGRMRAETDIRLLILSKERNPVVQARAKKLGIEALNGIDDKPAALAEWLAAQGIAAADTAYVGNDVNDLAAMAMVGLSACPSDAHPRAIEAAQWILPAPGGRGALRAMADQILAARG
ncbi:MAG: NTP transferase domain-containing protein [Rhodobacter sp.]|nr:NTP transferase domain-containing protein [Rhodobacter sp.]